MKHSAVVKLRWINNVERSELVSGQCGQVTAKAVNTFFAETESKPQAARGSQVIINVQRALQQLGYYAGDLNGSLGVDTRRALTAYQQDYGLDTTGAVDEATVRALGLI